MIANCWHVVSDSEATQPWVWNGLPISSAPDVDFLMPPRKTSRSLKSAQTAESRFAKVNGVRLHYLVAGKGDPVVLLHGYAETSHMWRPLMARARRHSHRHRP